MERARTMPDPCPARPTPQFEAKGGLNIIEMSLWDAVPGFLRRLDSVIAAKLGLAHSAAVRSGGRGVVQLWRIA